MVDEVQFRSEGVRLRGAWHEPDGIRATAPVVIVLSGDSPKGTQSSTWPQLLQAMLERQLCVFLFDFHSQGASEGERTELSLSRGSRNVQDALNAISDRKSIHLRKVGLLGSSFGGAVALNTFSQLPRVDALALKSPASFLAEAYECEHGTFAQMEQWKAAGVSALNGLSYSAYIDAMQHNLYRDAVKIKCPVLIVHGDQDEIVPIRQSRRLAHLLGNSAELVEIPRGDHNYKVPGTMDRFIERTRQFFADRLL